MVRAGAGCLAPGWGVAACPSGGVVHGLKLGVHGCQLAVGINSKMSACMMLYSIQATQPLVSQAAWTCPFDARL